MIRREYAQAKFSGYHDVQGLHDEVCIGVSKERVWAAVVINRHFHNGEASCWKLSKRLPDNSTSFATEATVITMSVNYFRHMDPVKHDVVVYSDSMSRSQWIEGRNTENPLTCQITTLLWAMSDKGTCVESREHYIKLLTTVHYTDLNPLVNFYIQQKVQTKWDVSTHSSALYHS